MMMDMSMEALIQIELWISCLLMFAQLLDDVLQGQRSPVTSYFLWPHADAWEELKDSLEGKPWVSERSAVPFPLHSSSNLPGARTLLFAAISSQAVSVQALVYVLQSHGTAVACMFKRPSCVFKRPSLNDQANVT